MTAEEYLALERRAETRSEFYDGEIFAMAGASPEHNEVVGNVYTVLRPQLRRRGCKLYITDLRVRIPATNLYTYPDLIAVCGPPRFDDAERDTLLNPSLIVEVLSPSTEAYDRGQKFAHYRTLPSLTDYVLVAQNRVLVEHFTRRPDASWLLTIAERLEDTIELPTLGSRLALAEVYDGMAGLGPGLETG